MGILLCAFCKPREGVGDGKDTEIDPTVGSYGIITTTSSFHASNLPSKFRNPTTSAATDVIPTRTQLTTIPSSLLVDFSESLHTEEEGIVWKLDEEEIATQQTYKALESIKEKACKELGAAEDNSLLKGRVSIFDTKKGWFPTTTGAFSPGNFMEASVPKLQYDRFQKNQDNSVLTYPDLRLSEFADRPAVPHPIGYLFVWDSKPGKELTPQQNLRFEELALETVTALQKSLLKAISNENSSRIVDLPAVWVDLNTKDWRIIGINKEWTDLTGIDLDTLLKNQKNDPAGLLHIMGPADGSSIRELRHAIKQAAAEIAPECSIPAILSPRSPVGSSLQFAVAMKKATAPPPITMDSTPSSTANNTNTANKNSDKVDMWMVEVHCRVQADTHDPSKCPPDAPESVRLSWQSGGSGGSSSFSSSFNQPHQLLDNSGITRSNNSIVRGSNNSTGSGGVGGGVGSGGSGYPSRGPSNDFGSRVPGKALSLSIANDILSSIPPRLNNLRFGDILGSGSYADVYSGYLGSRPVAIKVIEIPDTRKQKKDWGAHYEALLAVDVKHPNVITTYDWSRIEEPRGSQVWIVLERCDGGSLSQAIESGVFTLDKDNPDTSNPRPNIPAILETMREVARGMRYLYSVGEVHADLSSNNVLLTSADNERGFVAKVTDFGLSKLGTSNHQTQTFGTVNYMPPEVLLEGIISKAGDVYAYGVCFWEMICQKRAWMGLSTPQVIFAVSCRGERLELPSTKGENGVPKEVVAIVEKCMAVDASKRPSFEELCTELDALTESKASSERSEQERSEQAVK